MQTDSTHDEPRAEATAGRSHFVDIVEKLADDLKHMSPGDLAELRRMRNDDPGGPAFWKLAASRFAEIDDDSVSRWAAIVAGMAAMPDQCVRNRSLGRALATADVAEPRMLRLLRARGDRLLDTVRVVSRQLASVAVPVDWADFARLIFLDGGATGEKVRRRIASDYYRNSSVTADSSKGATA
jgi:CRISPR system Cascade subunit CasB